MLCDLCGKSSLQLLGRGDFNLPFLKISTTGYADFQQWICIRPGQANLFTSFFCSWRFCGCPVPAVASFLEVVLIMLIVLNRESGLSSIDLAHPAGFGFPMPQITGGILFAMAYEKEENLIVPITIHILGNIAIFSLALLF